MGPDEAVAVRLGPDDAGELWVGYELVHMVKEDLAPTP
jgi:hypothetical protein